MKRFDLPYRMTPHEEHALRTGARWRRMARQQLREHPVCQRCERDGRIIPAEVVHHVNGVLHNRARLYVGPFASLCKRCHDGVEAILERGKGFDPTIGIDVGPSVLRTQRTKFDQGVGAVSVFPELGPHRPSASSDSTGSYLFVIWSVSKKCVFRARPSDAASIGFSRSCHFAATQKFSRRRCEAIDCRGLFRGRDAN